MNVLYKRGYNGVTQSAQTPPTKGADMPLGFWVGEGGGGMFKCGTKTTQYGATPTVKVN